MEVVNLIGDRLFLDYLITQYFNYTYENNYIKIDYNSYLNIGDINSKLSLLGEQLYVAEIALVKDEKYIDDLKQSISILTDLKSKLS